MRLPFGLAPRKREKQTGPRYGDVYPRAMAAALDLGLLFVLLNDLFLYTRLTIMRHVDTTILYRERVESGPGQTAALVQNMWDSDFIALLVLSYAVEIGIIGVLLVSLQVLFGTTPGKWIMGLKVVKAKTLEPVEKWRYPLRFLAYIPAALPLMFGIFWAYFNKERRGWHDFLAGTAVISTRPDGWYWLQVKKLYFKLRGRKPAEAAPSEDRPQNIV